MTTESRSLKDVSTVYGPYHTLVGRCMTVKLLMDCTAQTNWLQVKKGAATMFKLGIYVC